MSQKNSLCPAPPQERSCRGAGQTPPTTLGPWEASYVLGTDPPGPRVCFLPDRPVSRSTPPPARWETSLSAARFILTPSIILHLSLPPDQGPRPWGRVVLMPSSPGTVQVAGKERSGGRRCPQRQYVVANYDNEFNVRMLPWQQLPWRQASRALGPQPQTPGAVMGVRQWGRAGRHSGPCSPRQGGGGSPGE